MQRGLGEFKEENPGLIECCSQRGIPKRLLKRHLEAIVQGGVCNRSKKSMSPEIFT
jgi:hypothetical protein